MTAPPAVRLVFATTNPNKVREVQELLRALDLDIVLATLTDFPAVVEPEETGDTFEANARLKALYYAARIPEVVVAEDSGLEVDALGGAPSVRSARFLSPTASYDQRFAEIYRRLDGVPASQWTARFVCAVVVARGTEVMFETRGVIEGRIAPQPSGTGGFGYDPIFYAPDLGCTLAEAGQRKVEVSHRARAFRALARWLEKTSKL